MKNKYDCKQCCYKDTEACINCTEVIYDENNNQRIVEVPTHFISKKELKNKLRDKDLVV